MKPLKAKESIIGLDIGPKEIRLVGGDVDVYVSLPENTVLDGVIVDTKGVARVIKNLFRTKGITTKNVVTAISGKGVILHLANVPSMGPEEIKDVIRNGASKYMAFAGNEILTDFYPLQKVSEEGNKKLKVLSAIAKKEIIDSYLETIKLAGLNLYAIDTCSLSLARAVFFKESLSDGIVILAAVEHDSATLFIFEDGKIHYLHNVDAISELDSEIESITAYCKSEFGESAEIKKIISTDLKNISIAKGLFLRETKQAEFPIKMNLLPLEEIRVKEFNRQVFLFTKALGVLAAILLFYFFFLRFQTWVTFRNIAAIQKALNKPNPALEELLDIERMNTLYNLEVKNQEKIILKAKGEDASRILREIKRIIPKDAYLSSLSSNEKGVVTFTGEAADQNAVFDFVRSLKGSRLFRDVKLEESKAKDDGDDARTYFVIKCQLEVESRNEI